MEANSSLQNTVKNMMMQLNYIYTTLKTTDKTVEPRVVEELTNCASWIEECYNDFLPQIAENNNNNMKDKIKIHSLKEYFEQDFTDYGDFGPDGEGNVEENSMTIQQFLQLPHFESYDNCFKALQSVKSSELLTLKMLEEKDVILKPEDTDQVVVTYGDVGITFSKSELIAALKSLCEERRLELQDSMSVAEGMKAETEKPKEDEEMPSVIKFKDYIELNKIDTTKLENLGKS